MLSTKVRKMSFPNTKQNDKIRSQSQIMSITFHNKTPFYTTRPRRPFVVHTRICNKTRGGV